VNHAEVLRICCRSGSEGFRVVYVDRRGWRRGDTVHRRVVVTGIGVVTPLGNTVTDFWDRLVSGQSGVSRITQFDTGDLRSKIAGQVKDFVPEDFIDPKEARRMDRFVHFAIAASKTAIADAGLQISGSVAGRTGVLIGSGIGGIRSLEEQAEMLIKKGARRVSPFFVPMMIPDMASGQVSIMLGARGHNTATVSACASGTNSVGDAFEIIRRGDADIMITGGSEAAVTRLAMAGFCSAKSLSTRNDQPEAASRPFDADRDGFVMGEGAGVLVLEELEHARKRSAHIYGEVAGYGATGDAYHIVQPDPGGAGATEAIRMAMKQACISAGEVDYINAHGTSTPFNDSCETRAVKNAMGGAAYSIPISSTKSMTGHLLGAAGAIESIVCLLAINKGVIPPTINYETPDPECDLDYVPNVAREGRIDVAINNSFGFGGHNAVLVFRRV